MSEQKIIWREWYSPETVEKLTAMKTLPRNETVIDTLYLDGDDVAAEIAAEAHRADNEAFRIGGMIVILEPPEFAGTYGVSVDWSPHFWASKEPA